MGRWLSFGEGKAPGSSGGGGGGCPSGVVDGAGRLVRHGGVLAAAEYEHCRRDGGVHHTCAAGGHTGRVAVIDAAMLRPDAQQRVLVSGLLAELGSASAAELSADLRLPVVTITVVLGVLERSGRARRVGDGWEHVEVGPQPPRRSWRVGGTIVD